MIIDDRARIQMELLKDEHGGTVMKCLHEKLKDAHALIANYNKHTKYVSSLDLKNLADMPLADPFPFCE